MLLVFDVDGTLIRSFLREAVAKDGEGPPKGSVEAVQAYDRVELLPRRREILRAAAEEGATFALATNQAGASLGFQTREQVQDKMGRVLAAFDFFWHRPTTVHIAYEHPQAADPVMRSDPERRRKPGPGLLREAMTAHGVDQNDMVFVGDLPTDRGAAEAADVLFVHADEFFAGGE